LDLDPDRKKSFLILNPAYGCDSSGMQLGTGRMLTYQAVLLSHLFLCPVVDIPGDTGLDVAVNLADVHLPQITNIDQ